MVDQRVDKRVAQTAEQKVDNLAVQRVEQRAE